MGEFDDPFEIRPGRIRAQKSAKTPSILKGLISKAHRSGHGLQPSGAIRLTGQSNFGRGRTSFSHSRLKPGHRRVMIKARITRHSGKSFRTAALLTHLTYLKRDGVTRDNAPASMFDATEERANDRRFSERCQNDRHHFRFIISPEDAGAMSDLRAFTRDLTQKMEIDLGTRLDWVAVDHWNTDNPHVHLLVRGVDAHGADLVISRDYISHGLRSRAEDLVSLELGPKAEHEILKSLERDIKAERWTRLDHEIRDLVGEDRRLDLRADTPSTQPNDRRRLMLGRLQYLEKMGLASPASPGVWDMAPSAEATLRDLGMRGDIIKTMHRRLLDKGVNRSFDDYVIHDAGETKLIVGRLIANGLHDELDGQAYAVIDGVDGHVHHLRFKSLDAFDHAPAPGGIVELRRFGGEGDPRPTLVLANRSDLTLTQQITAPGATWLDHRLVEREPMAISSRGFGVEVSNALQAREQFLRDQGLAQKVSGRIQLQQNLLETLRRREIETVGAQLSKEHGLTHRPVTPGIRVAGVYRQRLHLSSGRFAMIENGLGFQLVPWSASLDKKLGQEVSGIARGSSGMDWSLGRSRGLEI
jgi:type IV secretory pathway VirD2 relaxase